MPIPPPDHRPPTGPRIDSVRGKSLSGISLGGPERVTLEDVLEAGTQNLRLSLDLAGTKDLDFEDLDEAIESTRVRLAAANSDEAGRMNSDPVAAEKEGGGGVGNNEMHCLVALLEAGTQKPVFDDPLQGALERASIILHEAHQAIGFDTQKYGRSIDAILRDVAREDVERFARSAIKDLAEELPHHTFDAWMPAILTAARRITPSLCDWLAEISTEVDDHGRAGLWPFIIDDLLVSLKGRDTPMETSVHDIDPLSIGLAIDRLCQLPAIARSIFSPGMFNLHQTSMHDLLIRLMDGPARLVVGPTLLSAFKETLPFDEGVSFCVFAARQYDESIGWLLAEQLRDLNAEVSTDTQRTAAWMLMSSIDGLPAERRREVWVPGAIEWLGSRTLSLDSDVQINAFNALMTRVEGERQGFKKVWSRDCRRASSQALDNARETGDL